MFYFTILLTFTADSYEPSSVSDEPQNLCIASDHVFFAEDSSVSLHQCFLSSVEDSGTILEEGPVNGTSFLTTSEQKLTVTSALTEAETVELFREVWQR